MTNKRPNNDEDQSREPKHPRIVVDNSFDSNIELSLNPNMDPNDVDSNVDSNVDDSNMDIDDATTDIGSLQSLSPSPCPSPSYSTARFCPNNTSREESNELNRVVNN